MRGQRDVKRLYDGFRGALSHEFGTRGVALTHRHPEHHWRLAGDVRIINVESLIDVCEEAFANLCADLERDAGLRARVLPKTHGLLVPVTISEPAPSVNLSAVSASATGPVEMMWRRH